MIVGVDIDGVLADFNTAYRQRLIDVTGRTLIPPFVGGYEPGVWNYATDEYGYTKEEDSAVWKDIIGDDTFWLRLNPYAEADRFIRSLFDCEVYFITTRPGKAVKSQSEQWIIDAAPGYTPTVLIAKNAAAKGQLASGLGLTHFIDDRPENCLAVKRAIPSCAVYLLDHKYNTWAKENVDYESIVRICALKDFTAALYGRLKWT
jgi:hypothetical protein